MKFNDHSNLEGKHAFLSPSKYHWVNYTDEKFMDVYNNHIASLRGTQLHEYAAMAIKLNQKQPEVQKTLNMFINDAIGHKMRPEQSLRYSDNCFGTADAISYRIERINGELRKTLRIHDYKSGETPASMTQLLVYAALFCLEYDVKPTDLYIELRIYQNDECIYHIPEVDEIIPIMDKIVTFDKILNRTTEVNYEPQRTID